MFGLRQPQTIAPDCHFESLSDARAALVELSASYMASFDEEGAHETVVEQLARWTRAYEALHLKRRGLLSSAAEKKSVALIELHKRYIGLSLRTTRPGDTYSSINWDDHVGEVNHMLDYADQAVQQHGSETLPQQLPRFYMDIGIIPILFYIVIRCRDPFIRSRAIDIIRSARVQDGFWDSFVVSRVARRILVSEEGATNVQTGRDIPYARRVRKALVFMVPGERRATIEYKLQDGGWQEIIEW